MKRHHKHGQIRFALDSDLFQHGIAEILALGVRFAQNASVHELLSLDVIQVAGIVQGVLGSAVTAEQPLMEAGLDSLGVVELRNALASGFSIDLPATVILDYPTITALAVFIAGADTHAFLPRKMSDGKPANC